MEIPIARLHSRGSLGDLSIMTSGELFSSTDAEEGEEEE